VPSRFFYELDGNRLSVKQFEVKFLSGVSGLMRLSAARGETFMKHNAPWTDRTTNARNGLFAKYRRQARDVFLIIFGHSVDYGVYLEEGTENMREYPIIRPAIAYIGKQIQFSLNRFIDRMRG
jgi:hypothetical protein